MFFILYGCLFFFSLPEVFRENLGIFLPIM